MVPGGDESFGEDAQMHRRQDAAGVSSFSTPFFSFFLSEFTPMVRLLATLEPIDSKELGFIGPFSSGASQLQLRDGLLLAAIVSS